MKKPRQLRLTDPRYTKLRIVAPKKGKGSYKRKGRSYPGPSFLPLSNWARGSAASPC